MSFGLIVWILCMNIMPCWNVFLARPKKTVEQGHWGLNLHPVKGFCLLERQKSVHILTTESMLLACCQLQLATCGRQAGASPCTNYCHVQLPQKHLQQEKYRYSIHYCICTLSQANSAWRA